MNEFDAPHREVAMIESFRRVGAALGLVILAGSVMVLPAGAAVKVGPDQFFTGVINGHDGNTTSPITIRMACLGPVKPGETGHPMAGQTLAVHQLFPPTATGDSLGFTGNDAEIGAFFNAPPPVTPGGATGTPIFTRYDVSQRLPTSLTLPCGGTGTAFFTPIPVVPPSRTAGVPVRFVGQP
jgi:hypothetical protein